MDDRARKLIDTYQLIAHPEGGYFREVYRSEEKIKIDDTGNERCWLTDIYFLLTKNDISRFHRIKHDEIWHFYEGAPLLLIEIHPNTLDIKETTISSSGPSPVYKHCIKGDTWQAAHSKGNYSFVGCTVGPGFEFSDFEMLDDNKEIKASILSKHPNLEKFA